MDLTEAIKEAYANEPATPIFQTLEIDNEDFADPIRIVNSHAPLSTNQGQYLPLKFASRLPETAGSVRGQLTFAVSGVPAALRQAIRQAVGSRKPTRVAYREYLEGEPDPDAEFPVPLTVHAVAETHSGIEVSALVPDLVGMYFPRALITTARFPGLRT